MRLIMEDLKVKFCFVLSVGCTKASSKKITYQSFKFHPSGPNDQIDKFIFKLH